MLNLKLHAFATLFCLALVLGSAPFLNAEVNSPPQSHENLQRDLIEGLANGHNVDALLEAFKRQPTPRTRRSSRRSSTVAGNINTQMRRLQQALRRAAQEGLSDAALRALEHAYQRAQAAHLLMMSRFEHARQTLDASAAPSDFDRRHRDALAHYTAAMQAVLSPLSVPMTQLQQHPDRNALITSAVFRRELNHVISETATRLSAHLHKPPPLILRGTTLPVQRAAFTPRAPRLEPVIQPVYDQTPAPQPQAADAASSPDAPLSQEIVTQAEALGYDPVRIYEFVRNTMAIEWYAGAMKGAVGTLRQQRGNAVDQASLLIALLRASGVPARYVHGVVRLPIGVVMSSLGLMDTSQATRALNAAGAAYHPVIQGGRVAAVDIESTWVSAYVPYTNYRGTWIDASGPIWIPLMPAFKDTEVTPGTNILDAMALAPADLERDYLAQPQASDLRHQIEMAISAYLQANGSASTYAEQLGARHVLPVRFDLLPSTLPVPVVAVTAESATLDDTRRQRLRFVVRAGTLDQSPVILDHTVPVAEAASERLTLSYLPASVEDQRITNRYGGLDNVPAYLIALRPQLQLNGQHLAVAAGEIRAGMPYRFELHLLSPAGAEQLNHTLLAGAYHAIGVTAQRPSPRETDSDHPTDTDTLAARLLNRVAVDYSDQWTQAEDEFSGLLDVALVRPWPALALVSSHYEAEMVAGQPHQLAWQGVILDATRRASTPIARTTATERERDWLRLSALQGSILEHRVFEDLFLVDSISADKGLQHAREQGVTIHRIETPSAWQTLRPTLAHPPTVLDAIANQINLGYTVEIPATEIPYESWHGSVWRASDNATGSAGYFIAGGLAGGATSLDPTAWALDILRDILSAPNTEPPNENPNSAASIVKIGESDGQEGEVNTPLDNFLEVLVRDATGAPVKGAMVTFQVKLGGALLNATGTGAAPGLTSQARVPTDASGIARVSVTLGPTTDVNPVYVTRPTPTAPTIPIDKLHSTRADLNLIEASVVNAEGQTLGLASPFSALAMPQAVAKLRVHDFIRLEATDDPNHRQQRYPPGIGLGPIKVLALDAFDNPVSNVNVKFGVIDAPWERIKCASTDPDYQPYKPTHFYGSASSQPGCPKPSSTDVVTVFRGDCGGETYSERTTVHGANGYFITAEGVDKEKIHISAPETNGVAPLTLPYGILVGERFVASGSLCGKEACTILEHRFVNPFGAVIHAARAGDEASQPLLMSFYCGSIETGGYRHREAPDGIEGQIWRLVPDPISGADPTQIAIVPGCPAEDWDALGLAPTPPADEFGADTGDCLRPNPFLYRGHGRYEVKVKTHPTPGRNFVFSEVAFPGTEYGEITGFYTNRPFAWYTAGQATLDDSNLLDGVYGVDLNLVNVASLDVPAGERNDVIHLNHLGQTPYYIRIGYAISPSYYQAAAVAIDVFEEVVEGIEQPVDDKVLHSTWEGSSLSHNGHVTIPRNTPFDASKIYTAQVVINPNTPVEVRSDYIPLPVIPDLIIDAPSFFYAVQDVDVVNERSCVKSTDFTITLGDDARLSLVFAEQDHPDRTITLIDDQVFEKGTHHLPFYLPAMASILPPDSGFYTVPPGKYIYALTAVNLEADDTNRDAVAGTALIEYRTNTLPVGHTVVRGVDVASGNLVLSTNDLDVPGRGIPLRFRRTYSANASHLPGPLGIGWRHNYLSKVIKDPCGGVIVTGGMGDGSRFIQNPKSSGEPWMPLKGFHGTLRYDTHHDTFDYYSPDGTRFHYTNLGHQGHDLEFIQNPNGHTTKLGYDPDDAKHARLLTVEDPAQRTFTFTYEDRAFGISGIHATTPVIVRIEGPGGLEMHFDYDGAGHLIRAAREQNARVELYTYTDDRFINSDTNGEQGIRARLPNPLNTYTNPNGHTTTYTYGDMVHRASITVTRLLPLKPGETEPQRASHPITLPYPYSAVAQIDIPDSGATVFEYDLEARQTRVTNGRGALTTYRMADSGLVTEVEDPAGTTTTTWLAYDRLPQSRTNARGIRTQYAYDEHGNLIQESIGGFEQKWTYIPLRDGLIKNRPATHQDRNGNLTTFTYDNAGNLTQITDAEGGITTHTYAKGDRLSTKDPNGHITRFTYDTYGNLSTITAPLNHITQTTWDVRSQPTRIARPQHQVEERKYDTLGRLTQRTNALGDSQSWTHDPVGNVLSETDEAGRQTRFEYDQANRLTHITNAKNDAKTIAYDEQGNRIRETDFRGNPTTFAYDPADRLTQRTEPLGRTTTYTYDPVGNVKTATDALGRLTKFAYDDLDRRTQTTDALGGLSTMVYDGLGNITKQTDAAGHITTFTYDKLNRLTERTEPLGRITTFKYDSNGNRLSETDANGNTTEFDYDDLNRLIKRTDALGRVTTYTYDTIGNLIREIDARLHATEHVYDPLNRRTQTTDAAGHTTTFDYDPVGNLIKESWPNQNQVESKYDKLNRLIERGDDLGILESYTYDADGNPISQTDANQHTTILTHDELSQLTKREMPEDRLESFTYDPVGNRTTHTDANRNLTAFDYDKLNRLTQIADPLNGHTKRSYDAVGNLTSETDARSHTTRFTYDDLNQRIETQDPLNQTITVTYDKVGNKTSETDKRGIRTAFAYDKANQLISTTRAGHTLSTLDYDAVGNVLSETDANGHSVVFLYDPRNLVIKESRLLAAITEHTYDAMGDRIETTDPEGRKTTWTYDPRRRQASETNPANETTRFAYDGNGNRTRLERPKGNAWTFTYDKANRLTQVLDPAQDATIYTYDGNRNRLTQSDGKNQTTRFTYDKLNRLTQIEAPDGAATIYTYDAVGNRTLMTDPNGQATTHQYDPLSRLTQSTYTNLLTPTGDDLQQIAYAYDPSDNLLDITETYRGPTGTRLTTRSYDDFNQVLTVTDPEGHILTHNYDAAGNRLTLTAPGRLTRYVYDDLNRVESVITTQGATEYDYDRSGRLTQTRYPTGTTTATTYDPVGRTKQLTHTYQGTPISSYAYTYDANGNRTEQRITRGATESLTTYTYDAVDRLEQITTPDRHIVYSYDATSNRIGEQQTTLSDKALVIDRTYTYNLRNQLTDLSDTLNTDAAITFNYDANGNRISKVTSTATETYVYDSRNQLRRLTQGGSSLGEFLYDWQGLRIRKQTSSHTQRYVYDDQSVALTTNDAGQIESHYIYGPGRLLALEHVRQSSQYYLFDALGSVVGLSKPDGSLQSRYDYDAWGISQDQAGDSANVFGFTGHELDSESSLYYAKARYYDPFVGLFLNEDPVLGDPLIPLSLHRYLYAFQNPTRYVDPDGAFPVTSQLAAYLKSLAQAQDDPINEAYEQFSQGELDKGTARNRIAIRFAFKGALSFAAGVTSGFDLGLDGVVALQPQVQETQIAQDARVRLSAFKTSVQEKLEAASQVVLEGRTGEVMLKATGRSLKTAGSFVLQVAKGDIKAQGQLLGGLFELPLSTSKKGLQFGSNVLQEAVEEGVEQAAQDITEAAARRAFAENAAQSAGQAISTNAPKKPVIIGENMKRVNQYADNVSGETIHSWLAGREWTQQLNDEFISTMKSQGRDFKDIGPDFSRRLRNRVDSTQGRGPRLAYGFERRDLLNYGNYERLYERSGKYQGGVP